MKSVALLLVLALCVALRPCSAQVFTPCPYEVSAKCPAVDGVFPTFFAHPDDCSKGCECSRARHWRSSASRASCGTKQSASATGRLRSTVDHALCHLKEIKRL
ncbi:uncharacterized protein LOC134789265 [Penaeus indicus]|uniref:uncharacterized protein LOC134789265 n=1 Tax=Penaeus indicus TaxID=29960 RepID=UPI00300D5D2E